MDNPLGIMGTATSAVATLLGANDVAQILEQSGTVSVPALVVTILNCVILAVNAGIVIYKKIRDLKNEIEEEEEEEDKKNGTDGRAESDNEGKSG